MSSTDLSQSYDDLKYESDGQGPEVVKEPRSPVVHDHGSDLEAGLLEQKSDGADSRETAHGSSVSRALRSIKWKRNPTIPENEVLEKAENAQKPPEYTEEARNLVRSFTQRHFDAEQKQAR